MAEGHVRDAHLTDAEELGRIQSSTWRQAYERQIPRAALAAMTAEVSAAAWSAAIGNPPGPGHRVFVALEANATETSRVGFVAVGPPVADEDDAANATEIIALLVEPRWGRRGHGSRLLSAAVEAARDTGSARMICWVLGGDKASEDFLRSAGWERDGWRRTLDAGEREIAQHRMHTDISHLRSSDAHAR